MKPGHLKEISYFPGCSLATSARENNHSMLMFCKQFGVKLIELDDWNCCGSSSAHSVAADIGFNLSARNLSLADASKPLLAACPSCYLRLKSAQLELLASPEKQTDFHRRWKRPFNPALNIISFFDLLADMADAECIVTACAMCHLNMEIRSKLPGKTPVLHFSELLSLATGIGSGMGWFRRHLIDPRPVLRGRRLIA